MLLCKTVFLISGLINTITSQGFCFHYFNIVSGFLGSIGLLQLAIHVVQNRHAGEQKSHWDKTNKRHTEFEMVLFFVCLVPVRLLPSSTSCKGPIIGHEWFCDKKRKIHLLEAEHKENKNYRHSLSKG